MALPTALSPPPGSSADSPQPDTRGRRESGGAVFTVAGAWCARSWRKTSGPGVIGLLLGTYTAAMARRTRSPKKLGAWPSVAAVASVAAGAAYAPLTA